MRFQLICAGVVAAVATAAALAHAAPPAGQHVKFAACPYAGATASCLMIDGPDGTVYDISGVSPRPRLLNRVIRLRGTVTDKVSACNQGVVLERIRWTRTRQKCPN